MHQRALRTVLLIQAIEETDRTGEVIPLADRAEVSRAVVRDSRWSAAESGAKLSAAAENFLYQRAKRLLERLRARSPAVTHVLALAGGLSWLGRLIMVLALLTGVSLSALDGSRRINILAFPLLGLLAWNLLVYLLLLIAWLRNRRRSQPRAAWSAALYERVASARLETLLRHSTRFNVPLTNGLRRFAADWSGIAHPLLILRAKRLMHVGAALVAVGLIAGMYVRGIALRYEAGWESTFLGTPSAHALLQVLYGPAAALSGIPVGSAADIDALRWTGSGGGGDAARWIHLIALTAALYIVVPRLLAAAVVQGALWNFARRPPIPPTLLGYARTLVMAIGNGAVRETAHVIPYAYEPKEASTAGLESLLGASLGGSLNMKVQAPVRYGDESSVSNRLAEPTTWYVLLMTLAATPEVENHGTLLSTARDWLTRNSSAAPMLVLIDEAPYLVRMRGDAGFESRVEERRKLWREFVAGYGLPVCCADLTQMRPGSSAELAARDGARAALWTASERA
jgi:hypothetical protein